MCGFCGELAYSRQPDLRALSRMSDVLRPRGPDGHGAFADNRLGIVHRRLSVIDLSAASSQPMVDSELGLSLVFNGCIYNYRDLRDELQALGYRFFSNGDTEVIIKAYHAWGLECLKRLVGMFAFAVHERDTGRLVLARDRLGIKPLYYTQTQHALRFSSTLPSLLAGGGVDTSIDPVALHHYMSWHAVVPPPRTILNGVKKVRPATALIVAADGSLREESYWSLQFGERADGRGLTRREWKDEITAALVRAIKRRMIADVPTGVLLSGGLDSSLIVALLRQANAEKIKTFSVGFETVGDVCGDEFKYSDRIAEEFQTEHTRIEVGEQETLEALPRAIRAMSEPMMSHDSVGFFLLSEVVSKSVKVVQSGQGADEVFAGYHWYPRLLHSDTPAADYARVYFDRDHGDMRAAIAPDLIGSDHSRLFVEEFFKNSPSPTAIDKTLHLDTEVMLVDDPVKRVDNMTMAFGLETRVPFLDHELVELAASVPSHLKVSEGGKLILKDIGREFLPAEIIDRPKGYFPVPALKYIRGPFLEFVRDVLGSASASGRGIFNRNYVARVIENPETALTPKGHSKLWQIASLECWLQAHGV